MNTVLPFPIRKPAPVTAGQKYAKLILHLERGVELWTRQHDASGSAVRRRELAAAIHENVSALAIVHIHKSCPCGCQGR